MVSYLANLDFILFEMKNMESFDTRRLAQGAIHDFQFVWNNNMGERTLRNTFKIKLK